MNSMPPALQPSAPSAGTIFSHTLSARIRPCLDGGWFGHGHSHPKPWQIHGMYGYIHRSMNGWCYGKCRWIYPMGNGILMLLFNVCKSFSEIPKITVKWPAVKWHWMPGIFFVIWVLTLVWLSLVRKNLKLGWSLKSGDSFCFFFLESKSTNYTTTKHDNVYLFYPVCLPVFLLYPLFLSPLLQLSSC